jgi:S-DNA-T family DNA segregation ATPase FtsK/SpoIIIE
MPRVKKTSRPSNQLSGQKKNEIFGLVFLALSVLLFVALVSYDPNDLPFYTSYPNQQIRNLIGIIGAYIAGVLFFFLGASSFVIPFL